MRKIATPWSLLLALAGISAGTAQADEVTDWNVVMFQAAHVAGTNPLVTTRVAAIVQASVFDAVNGIQRRYTPIHVTADAPRGASQRAAAIQAAYASLVLLYPPRRRHCSMLHGPSRWLVSPAGLQRKIVSPLHEGSPGAIRWPPQFGRGGAPMASTP